MIWTSLSLVAFNQLIQMFAYSVLIPSLLSELGLSYGLAGTLTSAYMLALSLAMVPTGSLGDRYGGRPIVLAGVVLMTLGTGLFLIARDFEWLVVSRVLVGAGAAVGLLLPPPILAYWFLKDQFRVVVGLHVSFGKIGSVVAMWVLPPLIGWLGWRAGYGVVSLVGPLSFLVAALFLFDRPRQLNLNLKTLAVQERASVGTAPPPALRLMDLARNREVVLMAVSQFLVFSNYFGMTNWLPTYFKTNGGMSEVAAGFQTGFILWGTIIGYAASGSVANRLGKVVPLYSAGAALAALLTVGFATGLFLQLSPLLLPPLMVLYGLSVSIMVLTLPILVDFVPTTALARASGLVLTFGYFGAVVSPSVIGFVADQTRSLESAFWLAVVSAACACLVSRLIREERSLQRTTATD